MSQTSEPIGDLPGIVGARIRAGRMAMGLTQVALAAQIGCSAEMLRKYEAGAKRPARVVAERLAMCFGLHGPKREEFLAATSSGRPRHQPPATPIVATPAIWFPRTKLQPPRPRADLLARPRLVATIHAALQHARLLLITAPAGSGKTTLLSTALAQLPRANAWISLDTDDNDLARFLGMLHAAFDQLIPGTIEADTFMHVLEAHQPDRTTQVRQALSVLINAFLEAPPTPSLIILDDLHAIHEPTIHAALEYLIDQLPPHLAIVIATRDEPRLPLARLRARRELLELRLPELRFTADETVALLTECLELPLSRIEVDALHQRTEGWAAGLSLLAASLIALDSQEQRARFLSHLTQTDQALFDYLAEEVLDRQEPQVRDFLLETAILPELTPQICQALTGQPDSYALLDRLYRDNLFLVKITTDSTAGEQISYRYHDLFRAFLRERLRRQDSARLRALHRRAAECAGDPLHAIEHLHSAEMWDAAADRIEALGERLIALGAHHTLQTLIDRLPDKVRADRPRLRFLLGVCAWQRWDSGVAVALLQDVVTDFAQNGDTISQAEAMVLLSSTLGHSGEIDRARAMAEQALLLPLQPSRRVQLLASRAWQSLMGDAWRQSAADIDEALAIIERTRDMQACILLTNALRGSFISLPGAIARITRLNGLVSALVPATHWMQHAMVATMRAWEAIWLDDWQTAEIECQDVLDRWPSDDTLSNIHAEIYLLQPVCAVLRGQQEQAEEYIARLLAALEPDGGLSRTGRLISFLHALARVRWLQGCDDDLQLLYQRMLATLPRSRWYSDTVLCREIAALVHLAEGNADAAIAELTLVVTYQTRIMVAPILGDPRLHLAHAYLQAQQPAMAATAARPALSAIRREDAPGRLRWQGKAIVIPILRLFLEDPLHGAFANASLADLESEP